MDMDSDAPQSRLDILSNAYDAQMAETSAEESHSPEPEAPASEASSPEASGDEAAPEDGAAKGPGRDSATGKFVKPTASKLAPSKPGVKPLQANAQPTSGAKAPGPQVDSPIPQPGAPELKPPPSWKPAERDLWAKLPPEARAVVQRREAEITRALNEVAPIRQRDEAWRQTLSPFLPMLQSQGADPIRTVQGLLQAQSVLATGTLPQKASLWWQVAKDFGIPLEALNAAIEGQPIPQGQPQPQAAAPQQFRDARLDAILEQRQQELARQGQETVDEFLSGQEFGQDEAVQQTMADLLETAHRRRSSISLEDAYNTALRLLPDHRKWIQQREEAERAKAQLASTQRSRAAASSVRGQPAGSSTPQPKSRLDILSARYDELASGG